MTFQFLELSYSWSWCNPVQTFNGYLNLEDGTGVRTDFYIPSTATLPVTFQLCLLFYLKWNDTQSSFSKLTAGDRCCLLQLFGGGQHNAYGYAEVSGATGSGIVAEFTFEVTTNYINGYEIDGALLVDGGYGLDG